MTPELVPLVIGYGAVAWLVTAILHIAIAIALYADANRVETDRIAPFIAAWIWALAALVGGILVLAIYWLMYHSALKK